MYPYGSNGRAGGAHGRTAARRACADLIPGMSPISIRVRYDNRTQRRSIPHMGDVTELLHKWRNGDRDSENELFSLVLPDLRRLAHHLMKRERRDHSLQPTELVDQIYFRLAGSKNRDWESRKHFFAVAARAMRFHLIDHARGRPNAEFVAMEGLEDFLPGNSEKVSVALTVDHLLTKLAATKPEWCTLVEVKYFLGLTDEETAEALGLKLRTVQRMWLEARNWLFEQMESRSESRSAER
jgi:RNA polymerase sigma-70 factor, ECF subfamily